MSQLASRRSLSLRTMAPGYRFGGHDPKAMLRKYLVERADRAVPLASDLKAVVSLVQRRDSEVALSQGHRLRAGCCG